MLLPDLPAGSLRLRRTIVQSRGINWTDNIADGDLTECRNLSNRRWPYLATRNKRVQDQTYQDVTALTGWNGLVAVCGNDLLWQGERVGMVSAGEKQFAVVNTKLVIWPDKVYLDLIDRRIKSLEAQVTCTKMTFTADIVTVVPEVQGTDLQNFFAVGDVIEIEGLVLLPENNRTGTIKSLTADSITLEGGGLRVGEDTNLTTISRKVPDMDYICESGNRLWGVSNEDQTIHASALGDPTNFNVFQGLSTDSYAVAVGSEGDFTGCCKLGSSVLFWKERTLHKILGGYPAAYIMYDYDVDGVKTGCGRSITIINDVLYYVGVKGVYSYSGNRPEKISEALGTHIISDAIGSTDGAKYYLSVLNDGEKAMLTYSIRDRVWLQEDTLRFLAGARQGQDLYLLLEDGTVWLADSGEDDVGVDWQAVFTPFFETIEGRKRPSRLMLRVELGPGAWMAADVAADSGPWVEAGKVIRQKADTVPIEIAPNRCDQYRIRLRGHGPCVVKQILREYIEGGHG